MLSKIEGLSRSIVRSVYGQTGEGGCIRWRALHQICASLAADSEESIEAALLLAIERGWLEHQDGQTVRLTYDGRQLAQHHLGVVPALRP